MRKHLNHTITKNTKTYSDIEELLLPATFAMNSTFRKSTGLSANAIIFDFTPNNGALFKTLQWEDGLFPLDQFAQSENRKGQMFQGVFKRLHDAGSLAKYYHDANSTFKQREVGDKVLLRSHLVLSYANRKFVAKYYPGSEGLPSAVTKVVNNLNLTVKDQLQKKI